jgi:hypothetical protein
MSDGSAGGGAVRALVGSSPLGNIRSPARHDGVLRRHRCRAPAGVVFRVTVEASRGAPTPDAAADEYLMALSYGNEDGLLPILDNGHQDALLAGWRAYRKAMDSTTPKPSRLDYAGLTVGPVVGGKVEVTTEVAATWWAGNGHAGYSSDEHMWRFQIREDDGWQVVAVDSPVWSGGYVRPDACA